MALSPGPVTDTPGPVGPHSPGKSLLSPLLSFLSPLLFRCRPGCEKCVDCLDRLDRSCPDVPDRASRKWGWLTRQRGTACQTGRTTRWHRERAMDWVGIRRSLRLDWPESTGMSRPTTPPRPSRSAASEQRCTRGANRARSRAMARWNRRSSLNQPAAARCRSGRSTPSTLILTLSPFSSSFFSPPSSLFRKGRPGCRSVWTVWTDWTASAPACPNATDWTGGGAGPDRGDPDRRLR